MNRSNSIEALLESDDELPMDYYEVPATPAYLNDSRFDMIQFKWLTNLNLRTNKNESNSTTKCTVPCINILNELQHNLILKKGVLNKKDLFCIKSIEGLTGDSTFIWLLNFLLLKDIQANYMFLKSCLVSKLY